MNQANALPRHLRFITALYPRQFRDDYGIGFMSLLEDEPVTPRLAVDLLFGAVDAHLQGGKQGGPWSRFTRSSGRMLLNVVYLLLGLPLAIAYFVFIIAGFATGAGLLITLAGLPIIGLTILGARMAVRFESWLTGTMLNLDLPSGSRLMPMTLPVVEVGNGRASLALHQMRLYFLGGDTWKALLYLLLKFPFSIAAFTVIVTLGGAALHMLSVPVHFLFGDHDLSAYGHTWTFNGPWDLALAVVGSIVFLVLTAVATAALTWAWAQVARLLLRAPRGAMQTTTPASA